MVYLKTTRLVVRQAGLRDVPALAFFQRKNRSFHRPFEPIRPEKFYTQRYWRNAVTNNQRSARRQQNLLLHVFLGKKVIALIAFNSISHGAFQSCDLGYMLDKNSQGQGYMQEALKAAIQFMFNERGLHRIAAAHLLGNRRSEKLLTRLGFTRIGIAPKYLYIAGSWQDHVLRQRIRTGE